ncbi:MAG: LacI family DNA-binding transcriptional regulator [Bacteroidota bacterium]
MSSATIRDVAERAGVSISTVSRVLNDTARVTHTKRKRVLEAAEFLGYAPNPAARTLLSKQTSSLGVLLPFVSGEFFSELLHSLDTAAQDAGYFLLISTSHRHRDEFRAARMMLEKRVDGLIVMAPELRPREAQVLASASEPVVFINTDAEGLPFDTVNFDNRGGSYALTSHLLELGHCNIGIIRGPDGAKDADQRLTGFHLALAEAGITPRPEWILMGEYTLEAGYEVAKPLFAQPKHPTALLCANDYCAAGAIRAAHEAGLRVPDDLSVVGFDGLPSTLYTQPPLTTARVPINLVGHTAISLLLDRIDEGVADHTPARHVVPVEVLVRASTAPPPGV